MNIDPSDFFNDLDNYDRDLLYDDIVDSHGTPADIDKAFDDYDDRKAQEVLRKLDLDEDEYEAGFEDAKDEFLGVPTLSSSACLSKLGALIGSNHPADQLAATLGFGESLFIENREREPVVLEPISGKEHKMVRQRNFPEIKKNVPPFEAYVNACINGEEQVYLNALKNTLDDLYEDIFGTSTNSAYAYLVGNGFISSVPTKLKLEHLKTFKNIADIAIEINEFKFDRLFSIIQNTKRLNFNEGFA